MSSQFKTGTSTVDTERILLGSVVFAVLFLQLLVYPGVDMLVTALGAPVVLRGSTWFLAAELGASVLFVWVWGLISDARRVRVPLLRLGALLAAASYGGLAIIPQVVIVPFSGTLAIRAIQGAATIGVLSLAMTMLMDLPGGHGRNMGAAGIAIGSGTALGAPTGGLLYGQGPFVPLATAAMLAVVIALLSTQLVDRIPASGNQSRQTSKTIITIVNRIRETPELLIPYAFGFIDRLSAGVFALAGTLYFRTVFNLSPAATGAMLFLFFGPFALFQYPFGSLSDRLGRAFPIVFGSIGYGFSVIAVGLAPTVTIVGVAMVTVGVVGALMSPATMALVTDLASEADRGVAMAGFNATGSIGFLTGVILAGTVAGATGFTTVFVLAGAVEVTLAAIAAPAVFRLASPRTEKQS